MPFAFSRQEIKALFDGKKMLSMLPYPKLEDYKYNRLSYEDCANLIRQYSVAPKVDLLNTQLHLGSPIFALEKGLFKEGMTITDTTPIGRPLFEEFGRRIGFPEVLIQREIARFAKKYPAVEEFVKTSLLSPEAKESYYKDYTYRQSTLL